MKGLANDMQTGLYNGFHGQWLRIGQRRRGASCGVFVALLESICRRWVTISLWRIPARLSAGLRRVMDDALGTMQRRKERFL
jgi:hypothetical protein